MRQKQFLMALTAIVAMSCAREDIVRQQTSETPSLKTIEVGVSSLDLPEGKTAELPFSITDAEFEFCTNPTASVFPLEIHLASGTLASFCRIAAVNPGNRVGSYIAVIENTGELESFNEMVHLTFVVGRGSGRESFVDSGSFMIFSTGRELLVDTGLPVVVINTAGNAPVTSKTNYVNAEILIQGVAEGQNLPVSTCRIRGRGNTTWTWPKKPYLIALDKRQSLLGMPEHKRWVLLANFMDRTLMRNLVSMRVSSMTNLAWTPRCVPVELVLNGRHQGSYLLIEQVRVDENRLNISEDGGYLFELDFHYDNPVQWTDKHGSCHGMSRGIPFSVKYPDSDDITSDQISYAKNYIAEVADVIYGSNFKDPVNGYAKYLDVDSFIDYWIVYEVMTNHELNNPGSIMFHKDVGGKLTAGPCWDFDWGILSFYTSNGEYGLVNKDAIWYSRLFQNPDFKARVKARFLELKPLLQTIPSYMDECEKLLEKSAGLNFKMWNPADDRSQNGGNIINGDENLTFHDAIARLKSNYNKHLQIIESKL